MSFGEDMEQGAGLRGVCRYVMAGPGQDACTVPDADKGEQFWFWCNGCTTHHRFVTKLAKGEAGHVWNFSGTIERPTFSPSLLYRWDDHAECMPPEPCRKPDCKGKPKVCHLFVTDGQIRYLGDCTHALAGKTVAIEAPT
jgi:hypothetical protein